MKLVKILNPNFSKKTRNWILKNPSLNKTRRSGIVHVTNFIK